MKKNLLGWFAMATMLVGTGCSSDEVVNDYSPENAIQFGTYVGRDAESRAHITSIDKLANEGFGVFAYYTEQQTFDTKTDATPNFMYNQKVSSNSGTEQTVSGGKGWSGEWTYSPLKYWPNNVDDKVSFFAYAPYSDGGASTNFTLATSTSQGAPTLTYKIYADDVENQEDLLWATPIKDKSKNSTSPVGITDKVNFAFHHALARIGFKAEVMVDQVNGDKTGDNDDADTPNGNLDQYTTITINKVQLKGKFYNEGLLALANGEWSNQTNDGNEVTFELSSDATSDFASRTSPAYPANIFKKDDVAIRDLNNDKNYIMIIPQDFITGSLGKMTVYVEYDVFTDVDGDGTEDANDSKITNKITSEEFGINFEQGKAYTLNLHLGMTSVKLSATVTDWEDVTGTVVNVPINTSTTTP